MLLQGRPLQHIPQGRSMHHTKNSHISDAKIDWPALKDVLADAGYTSRPVGVLFADHFQANANDLIARLTEAASHRSTAAHQDSAAAHRAGTDPHQDGTDAALPTPTIRAASKSLRIRKALDAALETPGFEGILSFTLPEAVWLAENGYRDIVVAYPNVNIDAIKAWTTSEAALEHVTLMVDDPQQLDLIDHVAPGHPDLKVAVELDAAYRPARGVMIGAARSPLSTATAVTKLAAHIVGRKGFTLDGLMAYEGQIAGEANAGKTPRQTILRRIQAASAKDIAHRRAETVEAISALTPLRFVNGGGTGSIETTGTEAAITEVAAGSGLVGPGLFDNYTAFKPAPALAFGMDVVRRPNKNTATVLGGGWVASGPPGQSRLPTIAWPPNVKYRGTEGPGEVQTPLTGPGARNLRIGDIVWFRHAKAGEVSERINSVVVIAGTEVIDEWPTYRGEGKAFL